MKVDELILTLKDIENPRVYLGSPFTHPEKNVRMDRHGRTTRILTILLRAGFLVYEPIAHYLDAGEIMGPMPGEFWDRLNHTFLDEWANVLVVYQLPGWRESRGLTGEIRRAEANFMPILYLEGG
jgi:hypothetical protein